jgi:hypothetical protein
MELQDLLTDVLGKPFTGSGDFRLKYRYIHLTYLLHPSAAPSGDPDLSWVLSRLAENLAAKGWTIGEHSACCERFNVCRFFTPPLAAPVTHVALYIAGKERTIRQFQIVSRQLFQINACDPEIRVVTEEEHWKDIFTYHRREGGPLIQSGALRPWAVRSIDPLPKCQYGGNYQNLCDGKIHYNCPSCFPRSFASSNRARNIRADYTGRRVTARMVFLKSSLSYWFKCKCGHHFLARPDMITLCNSWCPYCAGSALCGRVECTTCFPRRFVNHPAAQYLRERHEGINLVAVASNKTGKFTCENGHDFDMEFDRVTISHMWCPDCRETTEDMVYGYLCTSPYRVARQPHVPNPNGGPPFRGDILVEGPNGRKILVEVDGQQHWTPAKNWGGASALIIRLARDVYKALFFLNLGVRLVRLHQRDAKEERFAWRVQLKNCIENTSDWWIQYLEAKPQEDSWKDFREEMQSISGQTTDMWLGKNAYRLRGLEEDPAEAPSASPATAERLVPVVEDGPDSEDLEVIDLALAQMSITAQVQNQASTQMPRLTGAGRVPKGVDFTCNGPPSREGARHAESCARYPQRIAEIEMVSGACRGLRGVELAIAELEPCQREVWGVHSISLLILLRTIPAGLEDEAISILSDEYTLPGAFLESILAAASQI